MRIAALDIRACRAPALDEDALKGGAAGGTEFVVYTLRTECGREASMVGFAGRSALGTAHHAAASLRPFFVGRDARDRQGAWAEWRRADRWWHHLPIYAYGPVDCCLWLLAAEAAGQPLWRYLGGGRGEVPAYASSLVHARAEDYAEEVRAVQAAGFHAYKIHPPGRDLAEDIAIHEAVRAAAGPDFPLISDPVQPHGYDAALRLGRACERLGFLWYEEPLPDEALPALRKLTAALDIAVIGTEVLAKPPLSLAEVCASGVVDGLRADVSWSGGLTGALKTAALAEAFAMPFEVHTAIFAPLEMVNLHLCAATHSRYFEVLWPRAPFDFGLKEGLPLERGVARLPDTPGLGAALEMDMIEEATIGVV
jgi:L-alanine-DL-glutamate epimerase-like enolase superfamily enzyme